jgi:hypothetical protein
LVVVVAVLALVGLDGVGVSEHVALRIFVLRVEAPLLVFLPLQVVML